jgi:hypothetical protein
MKDLLDSVILWECIILLWMLGTISNRVFNFTGAGPFLPQLEQKK